ncbi:hypothetical protein HDU99_002354 [Rhizoclosmatium hyalinum]|nr:hypothetical protein HDU99_002354 [Rhizoclosmatium hyalinum]
MTEKEKMREREREKERLRALADRERLTGVKSTGGGASREESGKLDRERERDRERDRERERERDRERDRDRHVDSQPPKKRRLEDVDDVVRNPESLRSEIWNILGVKRRTYVYESDDDDMEAGFDAMRREESRSARLARLEDEEEERREQERLKKKGKL